MHVLISEATGHSAVAGANSRLRSPWPHQLSYISPRERAPELGGGRGSLRVPGPVRECAGEEWREASEAVQPAPVTVREQLRAMHTVLPLFQRV